MGQSPDYPERYGLDDATLQRVVTALMGEKDHYHNFEVWRGEGTIRVNPVGGECVRRVLTEMGIDMSREAPPAPPDAP